MTTSADVVTDDLAEPQRYSLDYGRSGLIQDATGNWVQITDYWTLAIKFEALRRQLREAVPALEAGETVLQEAGVNHIYNNGRTYTRAECVLLSQKLYSLASLAKEGV